MTRIAAIEGSGKNKVLVLHGWVMDAGVPLRCRESTEERGKSMRSIKLFAARSITLLAALVALSGAFARAAQALPGTHSKLTPVGGGSGGGMIEISPTAHDVVGADTFDGQGTVNVHGLAPDTGYKLLRWVDLDPDGVCTGTMALSLPGDPTLTTSNGGAGAITRL
jgi:hypothetical protein